jgi:hypothetical protein
MARRKIALESNQAESALRERAKPQIAETHHDEPQPKRWLVAASGIAALLLFLAVYLPRLDRVVGLVVDDGWYVMLAKALATGQGYALINSPSPGILPLYPPLFPFLLSLVYRLSPQFPENVWLLKSVSIAAMLGAGLATYRYFARERKLPPALAYGIAVAAVTVPAFVFLATSTVMSECVFTLTQLLTMIAVERCAREENGRAAWRYAAMGGALAALSFLTRSIGLGLIVAALIYLLKEGLRRQAVIFAVGVALLVGPWMIYARLHAPTEAQRNEQNGYVVQSYTTQLWQRRAGVATGEKLSVSDIIERCWNNAVEIAGLDVGAMLAAPSVRPPERNGLEALGSGGGVRALSLILSLLIIAGFVAAAREKLTLAEFFVPISLLITVVWPWTPFRFVLPLAPLMIFYLLAGLRLVARPFQSSRRNPASEWPRLMLGLAVGCLVLVNIYDSAKYLWHLKGPEAERPEWVRAFGEHEEMMNWIGAKLPKTDVIATPNPPLIFLYTGNKTIFFVNPERNWEKWKSMGVRYLALLPPHVLDRVPPPSLSDSKFNIVYQSRGELGLRVTDFGPAAARAPWGSFGPSNSIMRLDPLK